MIPGWVDQSAITFYVSNGDMKMPHQTQPAMEKYFESCMHLQNLMMVNALRFFIYNRRISYSLNVCTNVGDGTC